jgi:hypothetical protein
MLQKFIGNENFLNPYPSSSNKKILSIANLKGKAWPNFPTSLPWMEKA